MAATAEFHLIDHIRKRARHARADVALGIGDDAALLEVPRGHQLVATVDTLVDGVHFPKRTAAEAIGWKALAVNLSDLAAMGATPAWVTLALTLPRVERAWVDAFLRGFLALAKQHDVALAGGDTTRGPLAISVQALGHVPRGRALRRDGAQPGDTVFVTGTLGDAAAGLAKPRVAALRARLDRPTPRVAAGIALRGIANACVDVSDGLAADLGHILAASRVGAALDADALPASRALLAAYRDDRARALLQLTGGDDYELCFTVPRSRLARLVRAESTLGVPITPIGSINARRGLRIRDADGEPLALARAGYEHFAP